MNYIGSKLGLLDFLFDNINLIIDEKLKCKNNKIFCDLFAGMGNVSFKFYKEGWNVISNDVQEYSKVILNKMNFEKDVDLLKMQNLIEKKLNNFSKKGFFYKNYSDASLSKRLYFTEENAKIIDGARFLIEKFYLNSIINEIEKFYLLNCLLQAMNKVSNVVAVHEAFLKSFKESAKKRINIKLIDGVNSKNKLAKNVIYNEDSLKLIKKIKGDILYLDPPYNSRQYSTNYHLYETLVKYDFPQINENSITGIRKDVFKSTFNKKHEVLNSLETIIKNANFKYIFISYNTDGILNKDIILNLLKKYGDAGVIELEHKRFKAKFKTYNETKLYELLFWLKLSESLEII
ncbi:DNA adenine methylase [Spiroplasma sp. DGKH1]|uniref:DNA adenine methylase n=1 Tax=Spiroplasma sp. DGKH1 TaxID=3050074 RepID=UPI0034C6D62A